MMIEFRELVPGAVPGLRVAAPLLAVAVTAVAAAQYATGRPLAPVAWLSTAPLLASLTLRPLVTALLAGWTVLLGLGVALDGSGRVGRLAASLGVLVLLAGFAAANSVLRSAALRRLGQARAVARVAQSALLREVPRSVAGARLASRYLSASAEARVGGDVVEVIADGPGPRWWSAKRGKGLAAVRLASVAATSFRDACAQPGLSLTEIARAVDQSVTRAAGEEDFVTAVFAELDPRGWLQLVNCGHPPPLRLGGGGELAELAPRRSPPRSACTRTCARRRSRCAQATGCCSSPTGCWKRATGRASSSASTSKPTCCAGPTCRPPPTSCWTGCAPTPATTSTTTSPCCWPSSPSSIPPPNSSLPRWASGLRQG